MLNTTSPTFVPSAPNAFPCHTDPSSKTNLQGFWMSHGFEIAPPPAKHFKVAFLPPLDKEEKEVEHDDEADEEVFPTRPLNDNCWCWWCCAQDTEDDIIICFQTSFFPFRLLFLMTFEEKRKFKKTSICCIFFFFFMFEKKKRREREKDMQRERYSSSSSKEQQQQQQRFLYSYHRKARRDNFF